MQIDMHYGAIYYLALLAGIGKRDAEKIAWSSQFVDDAKFGGTVQFRDGEGQICSTSAHRYLTDNLSAYCRLAWIPFHFVPSSSSNGYFLEKITCEKDSDFAKSAIDTALEDEDTLIRPYRFGVALHAYADSWAHHGFSGIWSDANIVDHVKPINTEQDLWELIKAKAGTAYSKVFGKKENALGHVLADVCPDLPYLKWSYHLNSGNKKKIIRDNPYDYKNAMIAIYKYMCRYKGDSTNDRIPRRHAEVIDRLIRLQEDNPYRRLAQWEKAIAEQFGEDLPKYDEHKWLNDALGKVWKEDNCIIADVPFASFRKSNYWRFCEAIRKHSDFIVDLMDAQGMHIL